jgi:hypothetical protein
VREERWICWFGWLKGKQREKEKPNKSEKDGFEENF